MMPAFVSEIESIVTKAEEAIAPLQSLASVIEIMMPSAAPQIKATLAILSLLQTQGPKMLADVQAIIADAEAAYTAVTGTIQPK